MLLYDIGNTNIKEHRDGKTRVVKDFDKREPFYYISVNQNIRDLKNGTNLAPFFKLKTDYQGMGVDRVAACYAIEDGVVVDAGSAITVDLMSRGVHMGGFIMIGINAYKESFVNISPILECDLDDRIDFEKLPQNTNQALNFSIFKSLYLMIKDISKDKKIYFCGGDGERLSQLFEDSEYRRDLVFEGMKKVIKEMEC